MQNGNKGENKSDRPQSVKQGRNDDTHSTDYSDGMIECIQVSCRSPVIAFLAFGGDSLFHLQDGMKTISQNLKHDSTRRAHHVYPLRYNQSL